MNTTVVALLLQMTASLLSGAQHNPDLSPTTTAKIAAIGAQAIQLAAQAEADARIGFAVPKNPGIWPNVSELVRSAYLNGNGDYVPEGADAALEQQTISFGDLNGDGLDDAAAIVDLKKNGSTEAALAVFLNQGGVMYNIADLPLGGAVTVYSHRIMDGVLTIDMQPAGHARATSTYALEGIRIVNVTAGK